MDKYDIDKTTFITSMSGGKDSTALIIYLHYELGIPKENIIPVFADTGWEAKETYVYLDYLECAFDIEIIRVQAFCGQLWAKEETIEKKIKEGIIKSADEPLTMKRLAEIKGRFPSTKARFCTTELKLKPIKKFVEKIKAANKIFEYETIMCSGVRRDESRDRQNRKEWSDDKFMELRHWLPILELSAEEVFDLHKKWKIEPNPLYKVGMMRVGCYPCINCNKKELLAIARHSPERFNELEKVEYEVSQKSHRGISSFFSADKCPDKYCSQEVTFENKNGGIKTIKFPLANDVKSWALGKDPDNDKQLELDLEGDDFWDFEGPTCQSHYGLCE